MPAISFVTVTWNSADFIDPLLRSIATHIASSYEVVIVDNGSTDATLDLVRSLGGPHRVMQTGTNLGFARGNNLGVAQARHPVTVLINPDCELIDASLSELAAACLDAWTLCGPRLLNSDGTVQPSASPVPGSWEGVVNALIPRVLMWTSLRRRCLPWTADAPATAGWLTGACVAAPTDLLRSLGPFDPSDHLYGEDIDLGLRAGQAGHRSLFLPDAATVVHHGDHASARRFADAGAERSLVTRRQVLRRNLGPSRELLDFGCQVVTYGGRYLAKRVLGRDPSHERAWLAAWRRTRTKASG
jgi:GT2 family glycosyltransferase